VARSSGIAADLFCPVDRRCDTYSVVVHLGGPAPPAQANLFFGPIKRTQSTLTCELNIRAADALDEARMPPGDERAQAMQKATILENAAEMLEYLSGRSAYQQNDG
jgi:hypothetical protein